MMKWWRYKHGKAPKNYRNICEASWEQPLPIIKIIGIK
jgi:hypothetical protein